MYYTLHTSTVHKTGSLRIASLAAHTTSKYINLWKLALGGHLNTDAQARDRTRNSELFAHENDALTAIHLKIIVDNIIIQLSLFHLMNQVQILVCAWYYKVVF